MQKKVFLPAEAVKKDFDVETVRLAMGHEFGGGMKPKKADITDIGEAAKEIAKMAFHMEPPKPKPGLNLSMRHVFGMAA